MLWPVVSEFAVDVTKSIVAEIEQLACSALADEFDLRVEVDLGRFARLSLMHVLADAVMVFGAQVLSSAK